MTLDERMREVFADAFEISIDEVTDDMSIENTSTWDSLRSITLSYSLEQAFGVEFNDRELLMIESYATIRQLLVGKGLA